MPRYTLSIHIDAPPETVFDLWTDLDRATEWVRGLTKITDRTGPSDAVGTTYVSRFGSMTSPTEVIEADRPRVFATRFGNAVLRGTNRTTFEPEAGGTRLHQEFITQGVIPAIMGWIFSRGSYTGSFRGEVEHFARLAADEARRRGRTAERGV
jgi:uncharacterized protein YndB with AHSA1/START domain